MNSRQKLHRKVNAKTPRMRFKLRGVLFLIRHPWRTRDAAERWSLCHWKFIFYSEAMSANPRRKCKKKMATKLARHHLPQKFVR
jgi:hypothetical protein